MRSWSTLVLLQASRSRFAMVARRLFQTSRRMLAGSSSWLARVACIVHGDMATVCGVWMRGSGIGSGESGTLMGDSLDILTEPFEDIWTGWGNVLDRRCE